MVLASYLRSPGGQQVMLQDCQHGCKLWVLLEVTSSSFSSSAGPRCKLVIAVVPAGPEQQAQDQSVPADLNCKC